MKTKHYQVLIAIIFLAVASIALSNIDLLWARINNPGSGSGSQTPWTSDIDGGGYDLTNAGVVGVGTSSPLQTLTVQGTAETDIFNVASSTGANLFYIDDSGKIGIGRKSETNTLTVWETGTAGSIVLRNGNDSADAVKLSTTAQNGSLDIYRSGSLRHSLSGDGTVTFNSGALDRDFNIKGDTDVVLFYVDAGVDKVGFGTSTPQAKIDIVGDIRLGNTAATTTCSMLIDGTLTYSKADKHLYICNGTAWQIIK